MERLPSAKYSDFDVVVRGRADIVPIVQFYNAGMNPAFVEHLYQLFSTYIPTAIQKFSIPAVTSGLDVVGLSQTGSGKTGAYLIPIVMDLMKNFVSPRSGIWAPQVLILAPTRELALQICMDAQEITKGSAILSGSAYGGIPANDQKLKFGPAVNILTATPGRLVDLINQESSSNMVDLSGLRTVVLDEADCMLEDDFRIVTKIFKHETFPVRHGKFQFLFFSATTSEYLEKQALKLMRKKSTVFIEVGKIGRVSNYITQVILDVPPEQTNDKLLELLQNNDTKSIIFVNGKKDSKIVKNLLKDHFPVRKLSSDMDQSKRESALQDLRENRIRCLVVTDVACRGIHIPGPLHVINYELPRSGTVVDRLRTYVHRIGRTGRMGHRGLATSFFKAQDAQLGPALYHQLMDRTQTIPDVILQFKTEAERQGPPKKPKKFNRPRRRKPTNSTGAADVTKGIGLLKI